ncbi:putative U-box domain-containing protein 58 [Capsella rubella]|uniref:putative U-box domain-containing protein 58 n=1 Tax=Capsella rubella TaxID=81985 RepID=UPI000CD4E511|nr:putative U-box domain-containing protein 58 [Capsella rubella]
MAMVDNSYVLFSRLCVELFHELPPVPSDESHGHITTFETLFLRKCQTELENSSPKTEQLPLVYVDESNYYRFIKTVRVLAQVFNDRKITETTRKHIVQVLMNPILPPERNTDAMNLFLYSIGKLADFHFTDNNLNFNQLVQISQAVELESNYNEQVKLREEAEDALARTKEEVETMERLLESYKEEQGILQLEAQALELKHDAELQLRRETETLLVRERERMNKVKIQLETLEDERDDMRLKAEEFESKYNGEMTLRRESEAALDKEIKELEGLKLQFETYKTEEENLTSQVRAWQDKCEQESSLRNETEVALSKEKLGLEVVNGLFDMINREADAIREERDKALQTAKELMEKRQPPPSFSCPITQEVMKDPQLAADGFTYEAQAIKKWFITGHQTSPMTNLRLSHLNLVPNRALRSAIEELD